ncbi:precorrin-6A reductase [Sporanaerobacter acetigenes]|uniref:Precorrin-6A/cobalt-precorrin-6A reductase n=1 Tax=Sporanaerobacter acetigenes DSM 13106 TaxID=1123281 RepID=A0A1M5Y502_9FIRM|nr:precorrin-6A reductase [Sporanaerobacter acetigenes]SHI06884.1 precorrin-6A/cobalt-precorrin-6A reductase [Sporanaerobacter acetigenes DSM 13106]
MIWIIGGTSEASILSRKIEDVDDFVITSATESEEEFIDLNKLIVGRMGLEDMLNFVEEKDISLIVDLSHPYAKIVSENARKVSKIKNIMYIRYVRKKSEIPSNAIYLKTYEDCIEYLKNISGTVFFTTGSKNIGDFEKIRENNRFIYRILPANSSIEECKEWNVAMKDIVAILGPFSIDFNKSMFKEYNADYVVMKDSGEAGGTLEKILACNELNILPIVIGREKEDGIDDLDEIEKIIRNQKKKGE